METIRAEDVRIPRAAREAVARHEYVVVANRERPAFVLVHPDDVAAATRSPLHVGAVRGRPLREALAELMASAQPDPAFADDMAAVLAEAGPIPDDPWAHS
jgi:hypothetical protein